MDVPQGDALTVRTQPFRLALQHEAVGRARRGDLPTGSALRASYVRSAPQPRSTVRNPVRFPEAPSPARVPAIDPNCLEPHSPRPATPGSRTLPCSMDKRLNATKRQGPRPV